MNYLDTIIYNFCVLIIDVLSSEKTPNSSFNQHKNCFLFVKSKIENSPSYIRFGLIFLTAALNYYVFFRFGRGLSKLSLIQKKYIYLNFQRSQLSIKRDILKFYKSFIVLYMNKS